MNIKKEDGKLIIDFLKNSLKVDIPRDGFLAGQSVCTALLYLKGKQKNFFVNDLDIFLPESSLTILERKGFSNKQEKMLHNMVGFNKARLHSTNINFHNKELRNNFSLDEKLKEEIIKHQKEKKANDDYNKDFINGLVYKIKKENTFYKEKTIKFESFSSSKKIFDTTRKGIFNYIYYYYNEYVTKGYYDYQYILKDFDINCTQIGICLRTNKLFYTENFVKFYNTMTMEICKPDTPYHSIIRFFKKQKEFGFNNASLEFESFYIANLLRYGIFSKKTKNKSNTKYNNYCFGDIYADKFKLSNINDYFTLYNLKKQTNIIKNLRNETKNKFYDYELYRLRNRVDKFDYIENGEHKELLEKKFGGKILGYEDYIHIHLRRIMEEKQKEKMKTYSYNNLETELLKEYKDIEKNTNSFDLDCKKYLMEKELDIYNFYLSKNVNKNIDLIKVKEINKIINKNSYLKKFLYTIDDLNDMYEALKLTDKYFNEDQIIKSVIIHKSLYKENYTLKTFNQGLMNSINKEKNKYSQELLSNKKYNFVIPKGFSVDILDTEYKLKEQSLYQKMVLTPYKLGIKNKKYLILSLFSNKQNRITFIFNIHKNKLYLNNVKEYTFYNTSYNKETIKNKKIAKEFISLNNIIIQE